MAETDGLVIVGYEAGPVEVYGRRFKMEYIGMASVFIVIAVLIYGGNPWRTSIVATFGSFFLFLGLKKKNRDHIMCSFLLFLAAALVPVILAIWAWIDAFWLFGLFFASTYLLFPRSDRPEARKRLVQTVPAAALTGAVAAAIRLLGPNPPAGYWPSERLAPSMTHLACLLFAVAVVLIVLAKYWRRIIEPHRINSIVFAALAPWDIRLAALFGMAAAVLLAATVFRHSIDSDRLRPFVKHAEWHFFYVILAVAIWAVFRG
ncbi:MAG: hypothetical protein P8127_00225 [Acidobacteriota bacterium]